VRLSAAKATIGSARDATLRIVGHGVAPIHCFILRGKNQTIVRRWAANARLNDRPFDDVRIRPGDRIGVGAVEFEVVGDESVGVISTTDSAVTANSIDSHAAEAHLASRQRELDEEARSLEALRREQEENRRQWQDERAKWQSDRDAWQSDHEALKVERESARKDLEAAQAEHAAAQTDREALQSERQATHAERNALEELRLEIERDRAAFNLNRAAFEEEMAKSKRKKAELEAQSQSVTRQVEEAEQDRKKLAAEKAALTKRRNSLDHEKKALEQLEQDLQSREKALAAERAAHQAEIKSAKSVVSQSLDSERKQIELLKETLAAERAALDAERNTLAEDQKALAMSRETLETDRQTIQSERQELDVERHVLAGERHALEEHYSSQAEAVRATNEDRHELDDGRGVLSAERERLELDREALQVERQTLDTQISGVAAEKEIVASQRKSLELQQQRLAHEQQALETARQMLESQRRNLEAQKSESSAEGAQLAQRTAESSAFAAAREAFDRQREQWQVERDRLQAELSEELNHCRRQLQDLNRLRDELDRERADWDERRLLAGAEATMRAQLLDPQGSDRTPGRRAETEKTASTTVQNGGNRHRSESDALVDTGSADDDARRDEEVFARLRSYALVKSASDGPAAGPRDAHAATLAADPQRGTMGKMSDREFSAAAISATSHPTEDEESIDDYMSRLMNRIRGDSGSSQRAAVIRPEPPRTPIEPPVVKTTAAPSPATDDVPSSETAADEADAGPVQIVARSAPPELGVNLRAMRDLANTMTRGAIRRHTHGRWSRAAITKSIGGLVSFVCGTWLVLFQATSAPFFTRTIGLAGVVAGGFWISQAAWLVRNLRVGRRTAAKSDAGGPTAQAGVQPNASEQVLSEHPTGDRLEAAVDEPEAALHA
jgi:hypothetical protein